MSEDEDKKERQKVKHDLLTAFGGKGARGFVQWLHIGRFLERLEDEEQMHNHNDRCDIIDAMLGSDPKQFDRLRERVARVIVKMAKENE